jgi:hypothetical protein
MGTACYRSRLTRPRSIALYSLPYIGRPSIRPLFTELLIPRGGMGSNTQDSQVTPVGNGGLICLIGLSLV